MMSPSWWSPVDFPSSLWPFRILQGVMGLAAPRRQSPWHKSYNVLTTIGISVCCFLDTLHRSTLFRPNMKISTSNSLNLLILYCTAISYLIMNLLRGHHVSSDIASRMSLVDEVLLRSPETHYKRNCIFQLLGVLTLVVVYAAAFYNETRLNMDHEMYTPLSFLVIWYSEFATIIMSCFVSFLMLVVWHRFKVVNRSLCCSFICCEQRVFTILPSINSYFRRKITELCQQHKISCLRKVYFILSDAVDLVKSLYGVPVLLDVIFGFVSGVMYTYHILNPGFEIEVSFWSTTAYFSWIFFNFFKIFSLTFVGNLVITESENTVKCLRQLILWGDLDDEELDEVKLFLQEASCSRVEFTACDFITLD